MDLERDTKYPFFCVSINSKFCVDETQIVYIYANTWLLAPVWVRCVRQPVNWRSRPTFELRTVFEAVREPPDDLGALNRVELDLCHGVVGRRAVRRGQHDVERVERERVRVRSPVRRSRAVVLGIAEDVDGLTGTCGTNTGSIL